MGLKVEIDGDGLSVWTPKPDITGQIIPLVEKLLSYKREIRAHLVQPPTTPTDLGARRQPALRTAATVTRRRLPPWLLGAVHRVRRIAFGDSLPILLVVDPRFGVPTRKLVVVELEEFLRLVPSKMFEDLVESSGG